ncbi:hypothetical protein [Streptomyces sp. NPDC050504]|uniref:hypothetical protein n=1 Tax=Streptomyces sp. NPDC050504 TaxID=3365618 RepID=UPI0037A3D957
MTTDPVKTAVVEEVAELRRRLDVALARIDGQLALLSHRGDQTDRETVGLASRLTALEHHRWPLRTIATLSTVGALAVTVWQALGR